MGQSGDIVTYTELEARENRLSHLSRARGLKRVDHYAAFMEKTAGKVEFCGAGEWSGLYYTCINSFLTRRELAYIVDNCEARVLIFSQVKAR
jgi:long-chain acyl-CoA synthetase